MSQSLCHQYVHCNRYPGKQIEMFSNSFIILVLLFEFRDVNQFRNYYYFTCAKCEPQIFAYLLELLFCVLFAMKETDVFQSHSYLS